MIADPAWFENNDGFEGVMRNAGFEPGALF
jgi:hypothetical protein